VGCGAGHPNIYQYDITLISDWSMVAVLTGPAGGRRVGQGDLPGGDTLVLADQVHAPVDERQVREDLGEVPRVLAGVRFYLLGVQALRFAARASDLSGKACFLCVALNHVADRRGSRSPRAREDRTRQRARQSQAKVRVAT
jgi:hypothetical protein